MPHPKDAERLRKRELIRQRLLRKRMQNRPDPKKVRVQIAVVIVLLTVIIATAVLMTR